MMVTLAEQMLVSAAVAIGWIGGVVALAGVVFMSTSRHTVRIVIVGRSALAGKAEVRDDPTDEKVCAESR